MNKAETGTSSLSSRDGLRLLMMADQEGRTMTLKEMSRQLKHLGKVNGELTTISEIEYWFNKMFQGKRLDEVVFFTLDMSDGTWLCFADRWSFSSDCYDYTIPDNRKDEKIIVDMLRSKNN